MSTEVNAPLAIPEQTIVGTGSYTIPANRYGFISMTTSKAQTHVGVYSGGGGFGNGNGSANSSSQWIVAGDSITTTTAQVNINGVPACRSISSSATIIWPGVNPGGTAYGSSANNSQSWSVSLYRIPKANLPVGTAEGE